MAIPIANETAPPTTNEGLGSLEMSEGTPVINAIAPINAKTKLITLLTLSKSITNTCSRSFLISFTYQN